MYSKYHRSIGESSFPSLHTKLSLVKNFIKAMVRSIYGLPKLKFISEKIKAKLKEPKN